MNVHMSPAHARYAASRICEHLGCASLDGGFLGAAHLYNIGNTYCASRLFGLDVLCVSSGVRAGAHDVWTRLCIEKMHSHSGTSMQPTLNFHLNLKQDSMKTFSTLISICAVAADGHASSRISRALTHPAPPPSPPFVCAGCMRTLTQLFLLPGSVSCIEAESAPSPPQASRLEQILRPAAVHAHDGTVCTTSAGPAPSATRITPAPPTPTPTCAARSGRRENVTYRDLSRHGSGFGSSASCISG
ncbi:hypothetical protein C2E23DRAFT_364274 [Lenzites betulinus]|nr:hypothetical protein C2E23DRAFT_364274 [Lenzites betulinus]